MKILHLNTHSYGGAAVVARRLHRAALAGDMASRFITMYGVPNDGTPGYATLKDARVAHFLRRQTADRRLYQLGKTIQRLLEPRGLKHRPREFEIFSAINERRAFADCADSFDPDVVHLHWVAGFVDHEEFFNRNRHRKFVWTLHDMNPFTGGCHYSYGCAQFTTGCGNCPQLAGTVDPAYSRQVLAAKERALARLADDQLTIVAPSRWLLKLSQQSPVTKRFPHVHIDNPSIADSTVESAAEARRVLGLRQEGKIVLFVSDNLRNPRKGIDVLFRAAKQLDGAERIHFVGLGQRTDVPTGLSVSFPGTVANEATLKRYYAAADLLVSPSAAENAPLVVIEALTCGTPVVSLMVGGVPELVDANSGVFAAAETADALAAALNEALFRRTFARSSIRAAAVAKHEPHVVLERYRAVYSDLLAC